jgi:hypothetical protein
MSTKFTRAAMALLLVMMGGAQDQFWTANGSFKRHSRGNDHVCLWYIASFRCAMVFGRYRGTADIGGLAARPTR